jgi:hypothetical protein
MAKKQRKTELERALEKVKRNREKTLRSLDDLQKMINRVRAKHEKDFEGELRKIKKQMRMRK